MISRVEPPVWLVVTTLPFLEQRAYRHIADQGFTPYMPIYCSVKGQTTKKGKHIVRSQVHMLFQGYMFVKLALGWERLSGTRGVKAILRFGDQLAVCPQVEIDRLKASEDAMGYVVLPPAPVRFHVGERVQITEGALSRRVGTVEGPAAAMDRLRVLISMLGRMTIVEINERALVSASHR